LNSKVAIAQMYARIPWETVADSLEFVERSLGTAGQHRSGRAIGIEQRN